MDQGEHICIIPGRIFNYFMHSGEGNIHRWSPRLQIDRFMHEASRWFDLGNVHFTAAKGAQQAYLLPRIATYITDHHLGTITFYQALQSTHIDNSRQLPKVLHKDIEMIEVFYLQ